MKEKEKRSVNSIFILSALTALVIAVWGIAGSESFSETADLLMVALKQNFSWLYLGTMLFLFCFLWRLP